MNQQTPTGSVIAPSAAPSFGPAAPGQVPPSTGMAIGSQHYPVAEQKSSHSIILTVLLVLVTLVAILFIGLYIHKYVEWDTVSTDVQGQIDAAVAMAKAETATAMEEEFAEREKYPYRTFAGPADYGSLTFEYPQTWSVYIARDARNGGDFEAYLNPTEVEPVAFNTINALRVTIKDASFDTTVQNYDSYVKNGKLQFTTREVGGILANVYAGSLPNGIEGVLVMFKLRDKTVMIQTDAALFTDQYYKILDSVTLVR